MKSILRVTSVGRVDSALYTCLASNIYGQDDTNIQLIVQGNYLLMLIRLELTYKYASTVITI